MGNGRVRVVLLMAVAMLISMAVPAFAEVGPGGYLEWNETIAAGASSPHGGYTTTTTKCAVCHAVHGADAMGEKLLRYGEGPCDYCHVSTDAAYSKVYGGDGANHSGGDSPNAHNYYVDGEGVPTGVQCVDCHQVHGAADRMSDHLYLQQKILVSPQDEFDWDLDLGAPVTTEGSVDSNDMALTKWCAACHSQVGTYSYAGGNSHVMVEDVTGSTTAWSGSQYCASCHSSGYGTSDWPHMTTGYRFLEGVDGGGVVTDLLGDSATDGACLRCHEDGAGAGVGSSF